MSVGLAIDVVVVAAEQLRLHRRRIEKSATYLQLSLGWACRRYAGWLLHALQATEAFLHAVGDILTPLVAEMMER